MVIRTTWLCWPVTTSRRNASFSRARAVTSTMSIAAPPRSAPPTGHRLAAHEAVAAPVNHPDHPGRSIRGERYRPRLIGRRGYQRGPRREALPVLEPNLPLAHAGQGPLTLSGLDPERGPAGQPRVRE